MSTLHLELQLLSPAVIAQRPTSPGQVTRSPEYVSGTVLRGGIATLWREQRGLNDETTFQSVFVQGQVRFGNAWPYRSGCHTWIVPRSAARPKRGGWFDQGYNGVSDLLTQLLRQSELDDMEPVDDLFVCEDASKGSWSPLDVRRRLISRTALAPGLVEGAARGVAANAQLYSFEALETGQRLRATITCSDDLTGCKDLIAALQTLLDSRPTIAIGQGRSRGLGLVQLTLLKSAHQPERNDDGLIAAITRFSELAEAPRSKRLIPITLEADTLLRDNYQLACSSADPQQVLARYRRGVPGSMHLVYAIQSTRWVGGWEYIRRLPRPPQLAVTPGSVWVFEVDEQELPAALAWWRAVEANGLGDRCAEGFGQLRIHHPFHDYRDANEERTW